MPLGIPNVNDHPLAISIFERIFHGHPIADRRVILRMKSNGRISQIFIERHGGRGNVKRFQIETGTSFEAMNDRFLYLGAILQVIATTRKY